MAAADALSSVQRRLQTAVRAELHINAFIISRTETASLRYSAADTSPATPIFPGATSDGQITDTGADGTGRLVFLIDNDDTLALVLGRLYISGVKVLLDNDFAYDVDELTVPVRIRQAVVQAID